MLISALIFDLGRVLVDLDFSHATRKFPQLRIEEIIKFSTADDAQFMAFNRGEIAPPEFHRYLTQKFQIVFSFADFVEAWTAVFSPMPGMPELLAELRAQKKVALGLLSDTDPLHWNFIAREFTWISASFPVPVLSYEIHSLKPAAKNFLSAAESIGAAPEHCLFIDDRADNIEGARRCGMDALQFRGADNLRVELARRGLLLCR